MKIQVSHSYTEIVLKKKLKNGMPNMVNRIENIGGYINFETQTEKGLEETSLFPFHKTKKNYV